MTGVHFKSSCATGYFRHLSGGSLYVNLHFHIYLAVPPKRVVIEYNSIIMHDGSRLTLTEGTNATVKCKSLATRPAAMITWYLDDAEVPADLSYTDFSLHTNDEELDDVTSILNLPCGNQLNWKVLRCQASVSGLTLDQRVVLKVVAGESDSENSMSGSFYAVDNGDASYLSQERKVEESLEIGAEDDDVLKK